MHVLVYLMINSYPVFDVISALFINLKSYSYFGVIKAKNCAFDLSFYLAHQILICSIINVLVLRVQFIDFRLHVGCIDQNLPLWTSVFHIFDGYKLVFLLLFIFPYCLIYMTLNILIIKVLFALQCEISISLLKAKCMLQIFI